MKRLFLLAVAIPLLCCMLPAATAAYAVEKSQTVVNINGSKYYIHTVQAGETLYALSREYGVSPEIITKNNPETVGGLKTGQTIKIPFIVEEIVKVSDKKLRKTFDTHTVQSGETLYAISRKYEISVSTIIEDNPDIDPVHLSIGSTLLIRKKAIGKADEESTRIEIEQYKDKLNSVASNGYSYHVVVAGETVYSLARRFGMTEEEFSSVNNLKGTGLRTGAIVRVRGEAAQQIPENAEATEEYTVNRHIDTYTTNDMPKEIVFTALHGIEPLKIALMLPLTVNGTANVNYLEFYQGFLLGLQKVKMQYGHNIDVTLFDTENSSDKVQDIVDGSAFAGTNMIVGPVYEDNMPPIIKYAEEHAVPVISPLANIASLNSGTIFQMSPAPEKKYEKIMSLMDGSKDITLIYSGSTDKEFESEVLAMLGNRPYSRHNYHYVHPSSAGANSAANLTSLLHNDRDNLLIVMSDSETDVERVLAALSSANTNIVARGMSAPKFTVLGNARWNRYNNLDRTMFFKNNVVMISTYHAKRDADIIKDFDSDYIRAFRSMPTLYSYRGYDVAVIFCPAEYDDIQYNMEGRSYAPLQTVYKFASDGNRLNHTNQNWMRVNYKPDFTITIE